MQSVLMQGSVNNGSDLVEQAVSVCGDGSFRIDVGLPMFFLIIVLALNSFSKAICCNTSYKIDICMPRIQKASKKNCQPSFLCSSTYK